MPHSSAALRGVRIIIAGAGLSGLVAARALSREGASLRVIEARTRMGGRIWTYRDAPVAPFHVELGGEFIDKGHKTIRTLCKDLNIPLVRVLRRGFGLAMEQRGRVRVFRRQRLLWKRLAETLDPMVRAFNASDRQWDSTVASVLARRSFREVLVAADAEPRIHALATAMRGFFLADPENLSALVAIEQLADGDNPGRVPIYRVEGGADRLVEALANDVNCRVDLGHVVRAVEDDGRTVTVTIEGPSRRRSRARADYLVAAVPVPLLLTWQFSPRLSDSQRLAFESLTYGPATKALLRFSKRWWREPGRPRAYGTNLPIGAVWESTEEQSKAAFLTLLAGAGASAELARLLEREGPLGIRKRLRWFSGGPKETPEVYSFSWESDPWSQGGYEYFSPSFDPALRDLLSRGMGRILFAGSHTSREFQGYMNGAVESGLRVAKEVIGLEQIRKVKTE